MKGSDPKEVGTYTPTEAAHYLQVKLSTLRAWVFGQRYRGERYFKPVVEIADSEDRLLSFNNLIEIHVLSAIRKVHEISLPKIRLGLSFVERKLRSDRPLLSREFLTDGLDLFVDHSGVLLNITRGGQSEIRDTVERFLKRVERNPKGTPIKLFPFSRHAGLEDTRTIVIDPSIAFGRPVLVGTAVPTINVFERFAAGEPIDELAHDFSVDKSLIEEAIRCEQYKTAA